MATRVLVAMYAWVVKSVSGVAVSNYWINVSTGGLPEADAQLAALNVGSTPGNGYAVSQYHCYFEDGGHARYRLRYDIVNAWNTYGPMQPDKAPSPLLPKPEWEVQEGV
jgi:hypothetical protein